MTARDLRVDYFRIYDVDNRDADRRLLTRGQFDREAKRGRLEVLDRFGACTMKRREPLFDPYAHLTWYRLSQAGQEPARKVTVRNQFGSARLVTGKVEALLCPAQKFVRASKPDFFAVPVSKRVDRKEYRIFNPKTHLVIYRTSSTPRRKQALVRDQFARSPLQLIRGVALAVPSLKLSWK